MTDAESGNNSSNPSTPETGGETPRPSQKAAYFDLFERMVDPLFLVDPSTLIIQDANFASERFFGVPVEEIIQKKVTDYVEEASLEEFQQSLRMAKRKYYPIEFESLWKIGPEKKIIAKIAACGLKLADDTQVTQLVIKDITREREAELKLKETLQALETANAKLEKLSTTDEMTKLSNFRHFKNQLQLEHERSSRYQTSYAIIFCDVDHFKKYNDRNGHPAGDQVLRGVAENLIKCSRTTDLPARYGGEEFVILCPQTDANQAKIVAERVRAAIEAHPFDHREHQPLGKVSISVGIASFPADGQTFQEVLNRADQGVYHSKENGRNQITAFQDLPAEERAKEHKKE